MYEPTDYLPLIGLDPLHPIQGAYYVATGDSGQLMTSNTIAGLLLSDLINNKHNKYKVCKRSQLLMCTHSNILRHVP